MSNTFITAENIDLIFEKFSSDGINHPISLDDCSGCLFEKAIKGSTKIKRVIENILVNSLSENEPPSVTIFNAICVGAHFGFELAQINNFDRELENLLKGPAAGE